MLFVRLKVALSPSKVAVIVKVPAVPFAVASTLACPLASVVAVVAESVAPAPLAGALKVTTTPGTGFPPSVSVTCRAVVKAALTVLLCGVPAVAVRTGVDCGTGASNWSTDWLLSGKVVRLEASDSKATTAPSRLMARAVPDCPLVGPVTACRGSELTR